MFAHCRHIDGLTDSTLDSTLDSTHDGTHDGTVDSTLGSGVQGQSLWPTFVAANAVTNIVGHYVCKHDDR